MSTSAPYLRQHENGTYYVHWTENRVGKRVSTRAKDLVAAKAFFAEWLTLEAGAAQGQPAGASASLADVWQVYWRHHVLPRVSNQHNAEAAWRRMEPVFGHKLVMGLGQGDIDAYIKRRVDGKLGRPVKPQTARRELDFLLAAIAFCAKPKHRLVDPSLVRQFDLPEPGAPRDRWLRTNEIQALLDAARRMRRGERLSRGERFLWLALETAGRVEALLDLTWDRVDFETGMIELDVPGRRKTKKRRATLPMSSALRAMLERAHEERVCELVLDNKGAIWPTVQHIVMEAGLAPKQKVPAGTKPKATGISPYTFRHTAATHMARRGVSLWKISKVLGNTVAVVERTYAKHLPGDLQDAVDLISNSELEAAE